MVYDDRGIFNAADLAVWPSFLQVKALIRCGVDGVARLFPVLPSLCGSGSL